MPLFRKKPKSPPTDSPAFRSVEHLPQLTDRRGSSVSTAIPASQPHPLPHSQPQPLPVPPPPYYHPAHTPSQTSLQRSQSQRHSRSDPAVGIPASPSAPHQQRFDVDPSDDDHDEPHDEHHSRRTIRNIFSLHSSHSPRDSTGPLERHRSLRRASPAARRNRPLSVDTTADNQPPLTSRSREYVVESLRTTPQSPMPPQQDLLPSSQNNPRVPRSPHVPSIQRSNTDSSLVLEPPPPLTNKHHPSPIEAPRHHPAELIPGLPQQPSLEPSSARPPSRQSIGPPSPLRPLPSHPPDVPQQGMSERPSTGPASGPSASSAFGQGASDTGLRNNNNNNNNNTAQGSEPGRSTPTSNHSRSRDEADLDVRTLVQKHDELQAKYSKVKRYYFEKEAQVQHLQNTVAHQRMAVSRTVLDDNEYANRFGRLDGAIKDLAFAVRKDWKTLPSWLSGFVNEDAASVGTKEMTAIGRAFMSRWLVDEVFGRYFHPVLEPSFSRSLKEIELNLRRQQGKTATEEDKENAIARISNWRRTTLDGLEDKLIGPAADDFRAQLIDNLVNGLVKALTDHLQSPPPPGIENGARMIVENAVGIAEKIPLESRDLCVDYLLPGTVLHEPTMKVETGIPPLTNASPPENTATRGSDDQDRLADHPGAEDPDFDSSSGSTIPDAATPGREQRVRSVFSSLMGRKQQQQQGSPPTVPGPGGNGDSVRPTTSGADDRAGGAPSQPRIRFSTFITADVRGRGPVNVLVKAPVYMME